MNKFKVLTDLLPIPSFAIVVFCFFMPFILVKCGDTEIASISGFDLVQGTDMKENFKDGEMSNMLGDKFKSQYADEDSEDEDLADVEEKEKKPSYLLLIALFMAINGFIVSFLKFKAKPTLLMVFSSIGFVLLVVFAISFLNADELKELNSSSNQFGSGILTVRLSWGFWLATFFFLVCPILFGLKRYFENLEKEEKLNSVSKEIIPETEL
uniref:hypothetical protein n=1 Tax=Flavobacterium sp. TaxID=239 RepID=UPI00404A6607